MNKLQIFSLICNVNKSKCACSSINLLLMNGYTWGTVHFLWQKIMGPMRWGFGGTWTSNLMTNTLLWPFEVGTIKTRCFLSHVFNTGCGEKDLYNILFLTDDEWMFLRNNQFLWQKMSHSKGGSTQNLRIHAECSAIWSGFWPILEPDGIRVSRTQCQTLRSCNQLLVIQVWTS